MPYHAIGHFVFWYRECYGFERAYFYSQAFFTLHSFLLVLRPPRGKQFNLKISRASCWSSLKHSPSPAICWNHNNPQKGYSGRFYLKVMAACLANGESASYEIWTLLEISEQARSLMLSSFDHSHTVCEKLKF